MMTHPTNLERLMKFLMEIMKESFEIELFKSESAVESYGMVKVYKIRTVIKMRLL